MHVRKTGKMMVMMALATLLPAAAWSAPPDASRRGPSAAALTACEGKKAGDEVEFISPRGYTVQATCRDLDGRLAARPDRSRRLAHLTEKLNLTAPQQEKVKAILDAEREKAAPVLEKKRANRSELQKAIHAGTADEATIRALAAAQGELKGDLLVARARAWKEIRAILTPEQLELANREETFSFDKGHRHRGKPRH